MNSDISADLPVDHPDDDGFGVSPFSHLLARAITNMKNPTGTTIALTGPWGSGKTSAKNFVLHHLSTIPNCNVAPVEVNCWCFHGESELAAGFLTELSVAIRSGFGAKAAGAMMKVVRAAAAVGPAAATVAAAVGNPDGAAALVGAADALLQAATQSPLLREKTIEELLANVTKQLADSEKRLLIVVDDIDRLPRDEALLTLRLIKTIGRLPNVVYLLIYDREALELLIQKATGHSAHYLDKIIQATFELPAPRPRDLNRTLSEKIDYACAPTEGDLDHRFEMVFQDAVLPEIRTPRDITRVIGSLSVSWPALKQEVNFADYLALETLRVLQPGLHRAIYDARAKVVGAHAAGIGPHNVKRGEELSAELLSTVPAGKHDQYKRALQRLFPRLEGAWGNLTHGASSLEDWRRERRACSPNFFDAYFRFELGDDALKISEVEELVELCGKKDEFKEMLTNSLEEPRRSGGTRASLLLEELSINSHRLNDQHLESTLESLFELGETLDVQEDRETGFLGMNSNERRLSRLMHVICLDRMTLDRRSDALLTACESSALLWLADFAYTITHQHNLHEQGEVGAEQLLVSKKARDEIRHLASTRLRESAASGELARRRDSLAILTHWFAASLGDDQFMRDWFLQQMRGDEWMAQMADQLLTVHWSANLGMPGLPDSVAARTQALKLSDLKLFVDLKIFKKRLDEVADKNSDSPAIRVCIESWEENLEQCSG